MTTRRTFLKAACAGIMLPVTAPARAAGGQRLRIESRVLDVNGRAAKVFGIVGLDGRQGLFIDAGGDFDVSLRNDLGRPTLLHWHGLTPPWSDDGVEGRPAPALEPGEERAYKFPVGPGGTHFMHAHSLMAQRLLAAPLIVRTAEDRATDEQEIVVMLHDFSFTAADELLAALLAGQAKAAAAADPVGEIAEIDHGAMAGMEHAGVDPSAPEEPPAEMATGAAMGAAGATDIVFDAFLANDRTLDDPEIHAVERGGAVRLRIINAAAATGFTIDLGALEGVLIAVDGRGVVPVIGRSFPLAMGQRADIRLKIPAKGGAFPVLALREAGPERTGVILATAGADVSALPVKGEQAGPPLDVAVEERLVSAGPLVSRPPSRKVSVELAGTPTGYAWGISGAENLVVRRGERIEIEMKNVSAMAHPMHLHGHKFQVVAIDGTRVSGAVRDTVLVPALRSVTIAVDADNPGRWPFHCHHLYHMAVGMTAEFAYDGID